MKKLLVILGLSLAVNTALLCRVLLRPAAEHSVAELPVAKTNAPQSNRLDPAQLAALESGNLSTLKAAAIPDEIARALIIGRAYNKLRARTKALSQSDHSPKEYWKKSSSDQNGFSKEKRLELNHAQQEYRDALRLASGGDDSPESPYSYFSAEKQDQLRRIEQDYDDMRVQIYAEMNGVRLSSDRDKLTLLEAEKKRDILAALSPEELEQYNLHSSPTANSVRSRFGAFLNTEADYIKVFTLQKAFDDQYNNAQALQSSPENPTGRSTAEAQLLDNIRAALGPENVTAFQHSMDGEYRTLNSLTKRLNLPSNTLDQVLVARDSYAEQSQQILQNQALSDQERRGQLNTLADLARTELRTTLGKEGSEYYFQQTNWINLLNQGKAFSTDPKNIPVQEAFYGTSYWPINPPKKPLPPKG